MPKKATLPELAERLDNLEKLQAQATADSEQARKASLSTTDKLKQELKSLGDNSARQAQDAQAVTDRLAADLNAIRATDLASLNGRLATLEANTQEVIAKVMNAMETRVAESCETLRSELAAVVDRSAQEMEELDRQSSEIGQALERWGKDTAEVIVQQRAELDASVSNVDRKVDELGKEQDEKVKREISAVMEQNTAMVSTQQEKLQRSETELYLTLSRQKELLDENKTGAQDDAAEIKKELSSEISVMREEVDRRLVDLDQRTAALRDSYAGVENICTRRVDWVIKNASKQLKTKDPSKAQLHTSWFSPKFHVSGASDLQLEFQLFRPAIPPIPEEAAGDSAIYLWATKGMNMVFRLYIGDKVSPLFERVYNGRVPFGTDRMCFLKDVINREDDTLHLRVEVQEAIREVEHVIEAPPPLTEKEEELRGAVAKTLDSRLVIRRHVNNRLYDQVKHQVELMNSRMVRRIDWRLQQASLLRRCFPVGQSICSTAFNAAGVEGMQLVFYPSGYHGATEGFCSFFLFAPAGASLRCWLSAGGQRREAHHSFEKPGNFGRTNFCRFESAISDEDDTVLLNLEIEEATQDYVATAAHPAIQPGDARSQAQLDASTPAAVESVVKLQRNPGKVPDGGLGDVRVLPSLWTATAFAGDSMPFDVQSFDDLRTSSRGGRNGKADNASLVRTLFPADGGLESFSDLRGPRSAPGGGCTGSRAGSGGAPRRSESTPALKEVTLSAVGPPGGELFPPLPPLAASGGFSDRVTKGRPGGRK